MMIITKFMVLFCTLTSLTGAAPAPEESSLQRRDGALILSDLQKEDTALKKLTTDVNAWTGTGAGFIGINNDYNAFIKTLRATYNNCTASPVGSVTVAQANSIVSYLTNTLEPDYRADVAAFINKKSTAQSSGTYNVFKMYFKTIQTNTTSVGNCIYSKTPTGVKPAASSIIAKINADVQTLVNAYP